MMRQIKLDLLFFNKNVRFLCKMLLIFYFTFNFILDFYESVENYKNIFNSFNRIDLINKNWCLNYDSFYLETTKLETTKLEKIKLKKVSFNIDLNYYYYSDVIYNNNIPLFFNIQNNWFFYDLIIINNIKKKFLVLFC